MKKISKIIVLVVLSVFLIEGLTSCVDCVEQKNCSDFQIKIEYDDFKVFDTVLVSAFGDTVETFDFKKGYYVSVTKNYSTHDLVKSSYSKSLFVKNKDDIPNEICKMKNEVLKQREHDKQISLEIENLICDSS